ncbi:hypothetical protein IWX90DRAFT_432885 [Phyllosticta citrichinensis]|uniref:Uncharacterized protein n=1 Tax=Phyllosticta citrichinensis TaxID=1130410 RepID=A0ABR1XT68_9PEZI
MDPVKYVSTSVSCTNLAFTHCEGCHILQCSGILDTKKRCDSQLLQIMAFTASSSCESPDQTPLFYASTRKLRRRRRGTEILIFQDSKTLKSWLSNPESSMVLILGSYSSRHVARDFAVEMIELVRKTSIPVAWALQQHGKTPQEYTAVKVLKGLVSQVLTQNQALLNEKSAAICASKYHSARTEAEWLSLLGHALNGLKDICFVIDVEAIGLREANQPSWPDIFGGLFESLRTHHVPTKVKVVLVSYRTGLELSKTPVDKIVIPRRLPSEAAPSPGISRGQRRRGKQGLRGLSLR